MPYEIKEIEDNLYKVCKKDGTKCFSKEGIPLKRAKRQMKAIGMTGRGKTDFESYLEKINLTPEKYLEFARFIAEHRGYNPDDLELCNDGIHKLEYDGVKFGRVGYNDKIIYSWLEHNNEIPEGTAKLKYTNYRKRAKSIMEKTNNKYSPASLSYFIIW